MDHSEMVRLLAKPGQQMLDEMDAGDAHLLHMAIGICGEAGELADAIKKAVIYRKSLDLENVVEELGDLEFYMEGVRQAIWVSREACLAANVKKLEKRYQQPKFSNQAAQDRADKQQG